MKLYEIASAIIVFVCMMSSLTLAFVAMFTGNPKYAKIGFVCLTPTLAVVIVWLLMLSIEIWREK